MSQVCSMCAITCLSVLHGIFDRILVVVHLELSRLRMERQEEILFSASFKRVIHGDIRMVQQFIQRRPLSMIILKTWSQERETLQAESDALWEEIGATGNILTKVALTRSRERRITSHHFIKNATERPNIWFPIVTFSLQYFGTHVKRRTNSWKSFESLWWELPG